MEQNIFLPSYDEVDTLFNKSGIRTQHLSEPARLSTEDGTASLEFTPAQDGEDAFYSLHAYDYRASFGLKEPAHSIFKRVKEQAYTMVDGHLIRSALNVLVNGYIRIKEDNAHLIIRPTLTTNKSENYDN